ncbi:MAG: transcription factor S [Metallosphaera sp.]|uniref:DNA-directed RNA polymerase, subunit M n=1 Tax=Metallosphaera cuprina (strain Ar-4) TaxID=1006006 RepID=F4G032_METCR|nr:transcription factor S [Metallosphaera cuprina]AEB94531.1 DNA-directed RNA polymerase, subunit M [Metallosphaera cuprina Ar-4]
MKFCPKCKSMMTPRKINGNVIYKCVKCGYEDEGPRSQIISSKVKHSETERTIVIEDQQLPAGTQKMRGVLCSKCGNDEVYFWMLQTRAADEPPTRFYKCTRCGKVWREYE